MKTALIWIEGDLNFIVSQDRKKAERLNGWDQLVCKRSAVNLFSFYANAYWKNLFSYKRRASAQLGTHKFDADVWKGRTAADAVRYIQDACGSGAKETQKEEKKSCRARNLSPARINIFLLRQDKFLCWSNETRWKNKR